MKRCLRWLWLLNKRLYKKCSFVAILILILVCVFAFGLTASQESGFLNIVLVRTDKDDSVSSQIVQELKNEKTLIKFSEVSTEREAIGMVKGGKADSAWIFFEKTGEKIDKFAETKSADDYVVRVVEREQNVFLRLSREKLCSKLYKYAARSFYVVFIRNKLPSLDSISDQRLEEYYDTVAISEELFVYGDSSSTIEDNMKSASGGYLTAPLRGILSVVMVLCGMAAVLYYMVDEQKKTFSLIPYTKRIFIAFAEIITAVVNVAAVVLAALLITGMSVGLIKEIICLAIFVVCCGAFCLLLSQIFGNIRLFGSVMPIIIIAMIAVCPVFFSLKETATLALIFPPTYYINAIYNTEYLLYMMLYAAFCLGMSLLLNRVQKAK